MQKHFLITAVLFLQLSSLISHAQPNGSSGRVINAGDLLRISVIESPDLDGTYPVGGDGRIDFGYVGNITVADKTPEELASHLKEILTASFFKNATIMIEIVEYVSGNLMILGEVGNPGNVPYQGREIVSLLEAVMNAGGLTARAAADKVKIFRRRPGGQNEREVIHVDLKRMMSEYDFTLDEYLRPRDIVVVPAMGMEEGEQAAEFLALGEFGSGGFHPVTEDMNVIRAVTTAGGVTRLANLESARILRPTGGDDYTVLPIDLARLFGSADMTMNMKINPGDIIYVPSAAQASGGKVYFLGEVDGPGMYPLPVNKIDATLARVVLMRGGLGKFSDGSNVRVQRKAPDGSQQTLLFDVDAILKSGSFDNDLPLQDEDVIFIKKKLFSF